MTTIPQLQYSTLRDRVRDGARDDLPADLPLVLRSAIVTLRLRHKHGLPTPAAFICGYPSPVTQRYVRLCFLIDLESSASPRWTDDKPGGAA